VNYYLIAAVLTAAVSGLPCLHPTKDLFPFITEGTGPIPGKLLEGSAGRYPVVRVTLGRVVGVAADQTFVFVVVSSRLGNPLCPLSLGYRPGRVEFSKVPG